MSLTVAEVGEEGVVTVEVVTEEGAEGRLLVGRVMIEVDVADGGAARMDVGGLEERVTGTEEISSTRFADCTAVTKVVKNDLPNFKLKTFYA